MKRFHIFNNLLKVRVPVKNPERGGNHQLGGKDKQPLLKIVKGTHAGKF